ncbi:hypothetical protein AB0O91_28730 [Kitasatospora sp. NPDC089797]|uniref:hypothetical protein n=1 Tax=Kitasatospora sp. NPDC089797 TaxID=3155298 RepID=UPI003417AD07
MKGGNKAVVIDTKEEFNKGLMQFFKSAAGVDSFEECIKQKNVSAYAEIAAGAFPAGKVLKLRAIAKQAKTVEDATKTPGLSVDDLHKLTESVMKNPARTKELGSGRKAFLGKDGTTIVIHDPMHPDGGTIFRRNPETLEEYWSTLN